MDLGRRDPQLVEQRLGQLRRAAVLALEGVHSLEQPGLARCGHRRFGSDQTIEGPGVGLAVEGQHIEHQGMGRLPGGLVVGRRAVILAVENIFHKGEGIRKQGFIDLIARSPGESHGPGGVGGDKGRVVVRTLPEGKSSLIGAEANQISQHALHERPVIANAFGLQAKGLDQVGRDQHRQGAGEALLEAFVGIVDQILERRR